MELLSKNNEAIMESTTIYYSEKLKEKVTEIFGANDTKNLRTIREMQFNNILRKPRKKLRMNKNLRNVKGLDNYKKFRSKLSLEQKNRMKELGFEFAGRAIHAMVSHILPDGALPMSTLLPYGGDSPGSSIRLPHHDHEITQLSPRETEATKSPNLYNTYQTQTTDDLS